MTARHIRVLLMTAAFAAGLVLCFGIVLIVTGRLSTPVAQQVAAIGGPFKLTDQNGKVVTDQDLKGHPFLVFFGFTNCPDVCPTALFEMSEILRALGPDADRMHALFSEEELADLTICCGMFLGMGRTLAVVGVRAPDERILV